MGLRGTTFVLLGLLVCAGAFVQRIAGFGLAVVAAPFVVTFAPQVMPAALLLVVLPLPVVEILRNGRDILWRPFGWAIGFRALTMPLGVWVVAHASGDAISLGVAFMVLVAVAGSLTRVRVRAGAVTPSVAGALTGVSATAASIGGPSSASRFRRSSHNAHAPRSRRSSSSVRYCHSPVSSSGVSYLATPGRPASGGCRSWPSARCWPSRCVTVSIRLASSGSFSPSRRRVRWASSPALH